MMNKLALVGLMFLIFTGTAVVFGQSGGGFDLSWSAIDGGGGMSSGSGFTISGTIGQTEVGEPLSGGNYALNGGFWQPDPACAVPQVVAHEAIQPDGNNVQLDWTNNGDSAGAGLDGSAVTNYTSLNCLSEKNFLPLIIVD